MKNKKLTYFLGLVVLVVWGAIIYRVFEAAGGSGDQLSASNITQKKEPYNDFATPKDTTHLLLNYRDPFGIVKQKDTVKVPTKKTASKRMDLVIKPAINWDFITYAGYILNPGSKKIIALVSINGQNAMLSEGETKNQVKLIKNLRDSIKISFNGKTKFIIRKQATL